ncbi:MAG TPA: YbaK/EbsC family protein [Acidimicrobiia bacterium]|nr:YbaK/EbsC family protein [Acidimicrobiia bacterium]
MKSASTRRLIEIAAEHGLTMEVADFPEGTRTAADAAAAIGCDVAAIVKSLVFTVGGKPIVALVPGDRRLDTDALSDVAGGGRVERASLETVRETTGYAAGGTPPFGHATPLAVYADIALRRHDPVWAAGGTPSTVFPISIVDLDRISAPIWAEISG